MFRLVLILCLVLGAYSLPAQVEAQGSKAYAPENMRNLSYPERVRVIEKEYFEQSSGRNIPDDQLEFYLDSIESGWGFSQIKADIATSLGYNNGNWRPGNNWSARSVICSSIGNRYKECRTPFRGRAVLTQQISKTRCDEGRNWGQRRDTIWVNNGCRARFSEINGGGGWDGNYGGQDRRVTCESNNNKYRECRTGFSGQAQLYRRLSNNRCDSGRDWGSRSGYVWVRNGCRAEFYDGYYGNNEQDTGYGYGSGNNNNYTVTCSSEGSNYKTCAWEHRYGTPRLIQQLSRQACVSGRTWGYDNRGLWVSDGCRARFGTR